MPDVTGGVIAEYQMTNLCPNTTMQFSIWALNLSAPGIAPTYNGIPYQWPNMIMRIVDASNNVIATQSTGNVARDAQWHQYTMLFTNGANTSCKFQIINNTTGSAYGNDVALDDISVRPCVPEASISPKLDTTLCSTTSLSFSASVASGVYFPPGYQWQYSTNGGSSWTNSGAQSTSNNHTITFSALNGPLEYLLRCIVSPFGTPANTNCHAVTDTAIIRIDSVPNNFLPADTGVCNIVNLNLDISGTNATSYLWNNGVTNSSVNIISAGTYWAQITSQLGCKATDTINITIGNGNQPNLGNDTGICVGNTLLLEATNPQVDNYLWSNGATASVIIVSQPGTYWVTTISDGCELSDTIHIMFNDLPEVDLGTDIIACYGHEITLSSNNNYPNAGYLWSTNANGTQLQVTSDGIYWLTIYNGADCQGSDTVSVTFADNPVVDLGDDVNVCEGEPVLLSSSVDYENVAYLWNNNSVTDQINVSTSGVYWLKITNDSGCSATDTVVVTINEVPVVDLGADTVICESATIMLSSENNYPQGKYLWNNGNTTNQITTGEAGLYWLTITNPPDCTGSDTTVIATERCSCEMWMPNAFSPNNDGNNDRLYAIMNTGCPIIHFNIHIYNRWGEKVFSSPDLNTAAWDGQTRGKPADVGTYYYYITYQELLTGLKKEYKGDITLVR